MQDPVACSALLDACHGETRHAIRRARHAKEQCLQQGDIWNAVKNGWVEGLALLLEGNPAAAMVLTDLDTVSSDYAIVLPYVADAVEALLLAGRHPAAEQHVERPESAADTIDGHLWAQTTALRCRGLLLNAMNDSEAATDALRQATDRARTMGAPWRRQERCSPTAQPSVAHATVTTQARLCRKASTSSPRWEHSPGNKELPRAAPRPTRTRRQQFDAHRGGDRSRCQGTHQSGNRPTARGQHQDGRGEPHQDLHQTRRTIPHRPRPPQPEMIKRRRRLPKVRSHAGRQRLPRQHTSGC